MKPGTSASRLQVGFLPCQDEHCRVKLVGAGRPRRPSATFPFAPHPLLLLFPSRSDQPARPGGAAGRAGG